MEHKRFDSVFMKDNFPPKESGYITATPPLGLPRNNTVLSIAETPWTSGLGSSTVLVLGTCT